ncbi:MAG: DoxX family protein [Steroidobacteraceae bacterium]
MKKAGLVFVFLWFLVGGIAHFALTDLEIRIVPPWIPWPRATVLVSGVLELLGAAGLLWPRTRRAAGIGLVVLTICVTPANLFMLQRPDLFPGMPYALLLARLPLQVGLLALIWWAAVRMPYQPPRALRNSA